MASMIYHRMCGSSTYILAGDAFNILSTVGISSKGLQIAISELSPKPDGFEPQFYCKECARVVPTVELICLCSHCGRRLSIPESYILTKSGGIYCKEDVEELASNPKQIIPLSKIIEKAYV